VSIKRRVFVLVLLLLAATACRKKSARSSPDAGVAASGPPVVTDTSEGLLFSWLDEKGEFHTGEKVADVPMVGKDQVRVMDPAHDDGSDPDHLFIVDLRAAGLDGRYPVHVMKRNDYDAIAEALRKKTGPTLASGRAPDDVGKEAKSDAGGGQKTAIDPSGAVRPAVIVYGASWCGACHKAMEYMKKKGIAFIDKDIEKDPQAAREMQSKLARAGMNSSSIPVLDVRGKMLIGFDPASLDQALGTAL
jgi:glutaredoxin